MTAIEMADKMECSACQSETSAILQAYRDGRPCPYCGLPAGATLKILQAQQRGANQDLVKQVAAAETRAARAEQHLGQLREKLSRIRLALGRDDAFSSEDRW